MYVAEADKRREIGITKDIIPHIMVGSRSHSQWQAVTEKEREKRISSPFMRNERDAKLFFSVSEKHVRSFRLLRWMLPALVQKGENEMLMFNIKSRSL